MSLYASEKRRCNSKSRLDSPSKKPIKSGSKLNLGALGDKNCNQYIDKDNVKMPEKLKYKRVKDKDEKMTSVEKVRSISGEEKESNKKYRKIGEIELDTGKVEVGYDKDKEKIVFSFVHSDETMSQREVDEFSSRRYQVYSSERVRSNDDTFDGGAMSIKHNKNESIPLLIEQFTKISEDRDGLTTLDEVIPFNRTDKGKDDIDKLRDIKSNTNFDRSNINKALSLASNIKNIKEQRYLGFRQKLDIAFEDVRTKTKDTTSKDDSYILYLLRKRLKEEGYLPDDDDDKDKDKSDENVKNDEEKNKAKDQT